MKVSSGVRVSSLSLLSLPRFVKTRHAFLIFLISLLVFRYFKFLSAVALALSSISAEAESSFCPSSSAWTHASCEQTVSTTVDCATAQGEVIARISGQYDQWHGELLLGSPHSICGQ